MISREGGITEWGKEVIGGGTGDEGHEDEGDDAAYKVGVREEVDGSGKHGNRKYKSGRVRKERDSSR